MKELETTHSVGQKKNKIRPPQRGFSAHSIRTKLIVIFVIIKVLPLVALAFFAATQLDFLGQTVKKSSEEMVEETRDRISQIGSIASQSSIRALDLRSREAIEALTTQTAEEVAVFLYNRDEDILLAASLDVGEKPYANFLKMRLGDVVYHENWILDPKGATWIPEHPAGSVQENVTPVARDNAKDFHYRSRHIPFLRKKQPLYHEMTFVDLQGREKIKVSMTDLLPKEKFDVSKKENTWCKAEDYFARAQQLGRGEIYVSKVIGPYIPSPVIGAYTPETAARKGIAFAPEQSGYAGKENPVGRRFQGLIRWVSPVFSQDRKIGYVTLALDHTHLMEFTDHIIPTPERYSDISDPGSGNYAFMWDFEGRNISHPRDYFIVGYDPATGEQEIPWLSEDMYTLYKRIQGPFSAFEAQALRFDDQSLQKRPAVALTRKGNLGLDCRYLNFAPQCTGWFTLTQNGGSGSFVIYWSNLWKLTTAAAIPYYTGMYKETPRGFGFVTIGANVDEFHASATKTASEIDTITASYEQDLQKQKFEILDNIDQLLQGTIQDLSVSTTVMVILVILIAIWMASVLSRKIILIIRGIKKFQAGDLNARLKVESQDELGKLARAFNEMSDTIQSSLKDVHAAKEQAEESDKAKSLFLANMSHEIRTPMNAIIGMNRLALESAENQEQQKLLEVVKSSASALLAVVNDILDFSKIEARQIEIEDMPFSLVELIESVMRSISVLAGEKDVETFYQIDPLVPEFVSGDSMRLRQILMNLLGNSVKFTRCGQIRLDVAADREGKNNWMLRFTVQDTGIGIEPVHLENIFNRFTQCDHSLSRKHQGSGLGLAISRKLCELMGGEIRVESEKNKGSRFDFTINVKKHDAADHQSIQSQSDMPAVPPLSILLVEDNPTNLQLAKMVLKKRNHRVDGAVNGVECLEKLAEKEYDIILMDVQMPEMDGFTATKIIRQIENSQSISPGLIPADLEHKLHEHLCNGHQVIIALTAHAMRGDKIKCLESGMDDYLTKPFVPEQLDLTFKKFCSKNSILNASECPGVDL